MSKIVLPNETELPLESAARFYSTRDNPPSSGSGDRSKLDPQSSLTAPTPFKNLRGGK